MTLRTLVLGAEREKGERDWNSSFPSIHPIPILLCFLAWPFFHLSLSSGLVNISFASLSPITFSVSLLCSWVQIDVSAVCRRRTEYFIPSTQSSSLLLCMHVCRRIPTSLEIFVLFFAWLNLTFKRTMLHKKRTSQFRSSWIQKRNWALLFIYDALKRRRRNFDFLPPNSF